jgi:hypothetical protein
MILSMQGLIKAFSCTTRSTGKSTLKIEIEFDDPVEMGFAVRDLKEEQARQKAPKPKPKQPLMITHQPGETV